ncbi:MAG: C-GCAxxG-C-C family (seleno)protein [Gallintestinimicrobium sp.]
MTIEERANQAAQWKATGIYNCAQAVTQAFADQIPVEAEMPKAWRWLCGGHGLYGGTCGALIGAVMAAGILTDGKGRHGFQTAGGRFSGKMRCDNL